MVYADDATGASTCRRLKLWWNEQTKYGPSFGYYPNASKTYLVVKEKHKSSARETFAGTDVHLTTHGGRHLGAALDSKTFIEEYMNDEVHRWTKNIIDLARVALSQPHAVYAAYVHGLSSRWLCLLRTVPAQTLMTCYNHWKMHHTACLSWWPWSL